MAKLAFPAPHRNLMRFMYRLKNSLWASKLCSPDSLPAPPGRANCTRSTANLNPPFKMCVFILFVPGLPDTMTNKFDHSQVNQTEQKTDLHLTVLKALVQGRIQVNIDLSFSGVTERESSVFPWCLFQSRGKKLQSMNITETGTSLSLPEYYTKPLFLPTAIAKMAELQGHVFC